MMELVVLAVGVTLVAGGLVAVRAATRVVRRWWRRHRHRVLTLAGVAVAVVFVARASGDAAVLVFAVAAVLLVGGVLLARGARRSVYVAPREPAHRPRRDGVHVLDRWGRRQLAYAFGARDKRTGVYAPKVKYGHSGQAEGKREGQVAEEGQVLRTDDVVRLADGPGGEPREDAIHARLDDWRYDRSEWFEAGPPVLAELERFERITPEGHEFLAQMRRRRGAA